MKPLRFLKLILVTLFILGAASGTPASANGEIVDVADRCEDAGGVWWGAYGSRITGSCTLVPDHSNAEPECADAGQYSVFIFGENDYYGFECASDTPGLIAGTFGFLCSGYGGIWDGDEGTNGICTFPTSRELVDEFCPPGYQTVFVIEDNQIVGIPSCVLPGASGTSSGTRSPGFSIHGGKIRDDAAGSAALGGGKNGSFYYNAGTCAVGCIYTQTLPGGAASSLPGNATATLYIRLAEGGTGSYNVCFDATGLTNPFIYQYISGAWVIIGSFNSGGQVCATASGDGAFALGGS